MREQPRILLVVAPTADEAYATAKAYGIDPACCAGLLRTVTSASLLRSWSRGTPFIALHRDTWLRSARGEALERTLDLKQRCGHLRIANQRDIDELRGEMA